MHQCTSHLTETQTSLWVGHTGLCPKKTRTICAVLRGHTSMLKAWIPCTVSTLYYWVSLGGLRAPYPAMYKVPLLVHNAYLAPIVCWFLPPQGDLFESGFPSKHCWLQLKAHWFHSILVSTEPPGNTSRVAMRNAGFPGFLNFRPKLDSIRLPRQNANMPRHVSEFARIFEYLGLRTQFMIWDNQNFPQAKKNLSNQRRRFLTKQCRQEVIWLFDFQTSVDVHNIWILFDRRDHLYRFSYSRVFCFLSMESDLESNQDENLSPTEAHEKSPIKTDQWGSVFAFCRVPRMTNLL